MNHLQDTHHIHRKVALFNINIILNDTCPTHSPSSTHPTAAAGALIRCCTLTAKCPARKAMIPPAQLRHDTREASADPHIRRLSAKFIVGYWSTS
jgi:hypothetical protein